MRPAIELPTRIARALVSASNQTSPTRSWTPQLEHTLHRLGCRNSLSPQLISRVIDPFLITHPSLALGFFNWASQQPQFVHDSISYQSILRSLSISRQFNAIDSILKQAKAQNVVLDGDTYGSVISSLIQGRRTKNAFLVFNEVKLLSHRIGADICNSLLAALTSDGYLDNAEKMFDEMCMRDLPFTTIGFGVFIWRFCRNANLDRVLRMLDDVKRGNCEINGSVIAVLIVDGLCKASKVNEAMAILNELRIRSCKPDFMAYRIVAEAFRSNGDVVDTDRVLKMKRKLGVAPRGNDYKLFVLDLISERRVIEAKELGEVIVSGNFPIDDDVLNALIGSASAIDPGKLPTLLTLSNLSRNLCKHGKIDELVEVFRVLSNNDYFEDKDSYSVMVSFLCKARRVREAYGVLQEMKRKGFASSASLYNSLLEACCSDDLLRPAKKLWDEMFANRCGVNLKTYNILIGKFSQVGELEEALRLFGHMLENGVAPDATTYKSLLEGLCKEDKIEAALDVFNKSVQQDGILSQNTLRIFILNLCRNGHLVVASELLRSLTVNKGVGHSDSHVVLLKCLADAREISIAIEHIKWVRDTSDSMLQAISREILASLSSSSNPGPILQLVQSAQEYLTFDDVSWKDCAAGHA
ncbi:pentatricopeptide repeat-containing protein [Tripterygium wilfordii]|uniref:Pentatricopeptide repeat-containing protein n=1 Tax=Tripterygium wilfordii TaxID=458696 RepID=A0A7J7DQR8_TRIWF|nr:pentatricopeptide repeat-containing protein [Tripterygium wilfordii]